MSIRSNVTKLAVGLAATLAVSAPALAAPCTTAKFSVYEATGFSCTIGDKTFSQFQYTQTTPNAPSAATVTLDPLHITASSGLDEEGFAFHGAWNILGVGSMDAAWTYKVATTSGKPIIVDAFHSITGSAGGGGLGVVSETLTLLPSLKTVTLDVNTSARSHGPVFFTPVSSLVVQKDLAVLSISAAGFATVSIDTQLFSQSTNVPEPASLALVGVGLTGLGLVRRRRSK